MTTIGSTVDPLNGDQNPYGLAIAPASAGKVTAGDLVICNFNASSNVQGTGSTIVGIHPTAGSAPYRIAQANSLIGCDALTLDPNDNIYTAAWVSNLAPIFSPAGSLVSSNTNSIWSGPFGAIYTTGGTTGLASVFVSNANNGSLARMDIRNGAVASTEVIATGFAPNTGVPGTLLGASGLTYNPASDTLYIVDGGRARLIAFANATSIPANGIVVGASGFTGSAASSASVIFTGTPLNLPISAALLYNGNIVIGNTGDNNLVEISPGGQMLGEKVVDTGIAGAIFGIATSGTSLATQKIYFNDDNANTVVVVSQ